MKKKSVVRMVIWLLIIGIICAFLAIYYVFNMPRRNLSKESAVYSLGAKQLINDYQIDETFANKKYLDKAITVRGIIRSVRTLENHTMIFSIEDAMEGVSCTLDSADVVKYQTKLDLIKIGTEGTFKGRCAGKLMDIQIINCIPQ